LDCVVRLIPGVLGDSQSAQEESFSSGLLDYPQYTRPADFRGMKVPEVLVSGNHPEIRKWRKQMARERTRNVRPDLLRGDHDANT
jgi:tRNA (guanine37-N1)-methyltransferase